MINSDDFEKEILNRISFMTPPVDAGFIPKTTPVISFGDVTTAKIATLGINPSANEFMSGTNLLATDKKRLADNEDYEAGPVDIWFRSKNYFLTGNAYWEWFQPLEDLLAAFGETYKNYWSSCHLDLSPWATFPAFGKLNPAQQSNLLNHDKELLPWLLANSSIKTLLVNGRQAYETINSTDQFKLTKVGELKYMTGDRKVTSDLIAGESNDGKMVLGWTLNLQAMKVSNEVRQSLMGELSNWLKDQIGKGPRS